MAETVYRPSQRVPESGIYRVEHEEHRTAHESVLVEGASFPQCAVCKDRVQFTLVRGASGGKPDGGSEG